MFNEKRTTSGGGGGGSGDVTNANNAGSGGVGLFISKVAGILNFKNINAGSNKISITNDGLNKEVDIDVNEANLTLNNIGGTLSVAKGGTGSTTAAAARTALGITPSNIGAATTVHTHVAADVTDFTSAAKTAAVANSITNGITDVAPSQNAVYANLVLKEDTINKGAVNGYAPLNASQQVPAANLPLLVNYGDGSDGDVVISSNVALTRTMFYNNLTVNTGFTLSPTGYKIYVKGTLTVQAGAFIQNNGNAGANSTTQTGGVAGVSAGNADVGVSSAGGTGGAGATGVGVQAATTAVVVGMGGTSGNGGAGGSGTSGAGGVSRAAPATAYRPFRFVDHQLMYGVNLIAGGQGGPGGSSGAGDGVNLGRGGGGGGAGGGVLFLWCNTLNNLGTIRANGGNGGNGANGAVGDVGGGGGGSGGGGGFVYIIANTITAAGTIQALAGSGGTGGTGFGTGGAGSAGTSGVAGRVIKFEVSTQTWS